MTPTPTALPPIPVPSGVLEDVRSLPAPGNDSVEYVGTHEDSWVGGQVGGVGDVDGDGYDDWITLDSEGNYPSNNLDAQLVWGRPKGSGPASFAVWKFPADAGVTIPSSLDEDIGYAGLGDVDGDGYGDVLFSSVSYDQPSWLRIVFGGPRAALVAPWQADRELVLTGTPARFHRMATVAGDVNGDGYTDLLFSAGAGYLALGGPWMSQRGSHQLTLTTISSPDGGSIEATPEQPGDVDGDGLDDLLFDVRYVGTTMPGSPGPLGGFVLYGMKDWPADRSIDKADYASVRCTFLHHAQSLTVCAAGDSNGDGYADFACGAYNLSPPGWSQPGVPGEAIVVRGGPSLPRFLDLTTVRAPQAQRFVGPYSDSYLGATVWPAGDRNGDGLDDLFAWSKHSASVQYSGIWVLFGSKAPVGPEGILDTRTATASQVRLLDVGAGWYYDFSVSAAGDINGDGSQDAVMGQTGYLRSDPAMGTINGRAIAIASTAVQTSDTMHFSRAKAGLSAPRGPRLLGRRTWPTGDAAVGFADGHGPAGADQPSLQRVVARPAPTPAADMGALPVAGWDITSNREQWTTATLELNLRPAQLVPVAAGSVRLLRRGAGDSEWTTVTMRMAPAGYSATADTDRLGSFVVAGDARPFISPTPSPTVSATPTYTPTPTITPSPTETPLPSCTPWIGYPASFHFTTGPTIDVAVNEQFSVGYGSSGCPSCGRCCSGCAPGVPSLFWDSGRLTQVSAPPYQCQYDPYYYSICNEFIFQATALGTTTITMRGTTLTSDTLTVRVGTPIPPASTPVMLSDIGAQVPGASLEFTDQTIESVSAVGDMNRDGFADLAVRAGYRTVIVLGRALGGVIPSVAPASTREDVREMRFGVSNPTVVGGGDADGDGYPDLLVAVASSTSVWLLTGASAILPSGVNDPFTLTPGPTVAQFTGANQPGWLSDLDGDGRTDFQLFATGSSLTALLRGQSPQALAANPAAVDATTRNTLWFGTSSVALSGTGDYNGDGHKDIAITSKSYTPDVISLGTGTLRANLQTTDARAWLSLEGNTVLPGWLYGIGDVNGDGRSDLLLQNSNKTVQSTSKAGEAVLVFGSPTFTNGSTTVVESLGASGAVTFEGSGFETRVGSKLLGLGDINGDAYADFLIGTYASEAYVIFGRPDWTSVGRTVKLTSLTPELGFRLEGGIIDSAGIAGDFNGDGMQDAWLQGRNSQLYILFGSASSHRAPQQIFLADGMVVPQPVGDPNNGLQMGFADGEGPVAGGASRVSVVLRHEAPRQRPGLEPRCWYVSTNRDGWTTATLVFEGITLGIDPAKSPAETPRLLWSSNFASQWQAIPAVWDPERRTLTAEVSALGYFAVGTVETLGALPNGFLVK